MYSSLFFHTSYPNPKLLQGLFSLSPPPRLFFLLSWTFVAAWTFSSCNTQAFHWGGFSRSRGQALGHGLGCPTACGNFPDQGSNLCPLHWQTDSQPLDHQGSPVIVIGHLGLRIRFGDLLGCTVYRNMPASKGDTGSIPGLERFHMPQSN